MARTQRTPRFPMGTRVLKHFVGYPKPFGGTVDRFSTHSGFYHISYDDGDSEEMTEEDVETHFKSLPKKKRSAPSPKDDRSDASSSLLLLASKPTASSGAKTESPRERITPIPSRSVEDVDVSVEEINRLMGKLICKPVVDERGEETVVKGTVSSYFPATKMYRILYFNGTCDDLTHDEVLESLPVVVAVPSPRSDAKKRKGGEKSPTSPKRVKTLNLTNDKPITTSSEDDRSQSKKNGNLANGTINRGATYEVADKNNVLNRSGAYNIVRKVLYIVASNKAVTTDLKNEQLKILSNDQLKSKQALIQFVEKDGLKSLHECLSLWVKSKDTEQGVLLVLKVLVSLPGITVDRVRESGMGKKLGDIRKCRDMPQMNQETIDLAMWLIKDWKSKFSDGDKKTSDRENKPKKSKDAMPVKEVKAPEAVSPRSNENGLKKTARGSNSADHLRHIMRDKGSRRLGPAHAHRARRSTVLLEAVKQRVMQNTEAAEKEKTREERASKEDVWTSSRVKFGKIDTLEFNKDVQVALLLSNGRLFKLPAKLKKGSQEEKPLKSILRVKLAPSDQEKLINRELLSMNDAMDGSNASTTMADGARDESKSSGLDSTHDEPMDEDVDDQASVGLKPPSPPRPHFSSAEESDLFIDVKLVEDNPSSAEPTPVDLEGNDGSSAVDEDEPMEEANEEETKTADVQGNNENGEPEDTSESTQPNEEEGSTEDTKPTEKSESIEDVAVGKNGAAEDDKLNIGEPLATGMLNPVASPITSVSSDSPSSPESGEISDDDEVEEENKEMSPSASESTAQSTVDQGASEMEVDPSSTLCEDVRDVQTSSSI
ncbi:hypothetical protein Poli38472_003176 [Pythium oligandrum]|uniref:PTM/DIR17-like Tudor domain-containing protein n=1 Tax=Pythium oligandrum TaxID=41045 RepID=A0A8K1C6D1_PYTOL|nr:hypothetical protein Poli38472_003176 [Pythium oligandrum]|eukprot:TMW57251.1 hypothetical protein Poli38472_003176 [Pythium oligandrum]